MSCATKSTGPAGPAPWSVPATIADAAATRTRTWNLEPGTWNLFMPPSSTLCVHDATDADARGLVARLGPGRGVFLPKTARGVRSDHRLPPARDRRRRRNRRFSREDDDRQPVGSAAADVLRADCRVHAGRR